MRTTNKRCISNYRTKQHNTDTRNGLAKENKINNREHPNGREQRIEKQKKNNREVSGLIPKLYDHKGRRKKYTTFHWNRDNIR